MSAGDDIEQLAEWTATTLASARYRADFSAASLWEVERFFADNVVDGTARPGSLLAESTELRLFAIGCYVGEVVRRARGGAWLLDEPDARVGRDVALRLHDGTIVRPVERVGKRFADGPEDSIAAYGVALGLDVGPQPRRRRFRR